VSLGGDRREGGWAVADKIRELPVDDFFAKGRVREDGRMMHDKSRRRAKSKAKWDYYKLLRSIPTEEVAQPVSESKCSLVKPGERPGCT
jgi:branched-chain amino acid transport system substrate-binding protein